MEVVAYATRDADVANVRSDLSGCHWLELTAPVFELAVAMGHSDRLRAHASGARLVPTELRTLHGTRVCRVELAHPQEVPPLRERLHRAGLPTYEADVRFAYRQLIDRGIRRRCASTAPPLP